MSTFEHAFWAAVDDMNTGRLQDPDHYLRMVPLARRDELARRLAAVLANRGPLAGVDDVAAEGYARALAAIEEVGGSAGPAGILPGALRRLRKARGIERDQVLDALAAEFGIGPSGRDALRRYYHQLESGSLLGPRIAHRLLRSLANIFAADPEDFIAAVRPAGPARRVSMAPAMGRGAGQEYAPQGAGGQRRDLVGPDSDVEVVERLFTGGPDA